MFKTNFYAWYSKYYKWTSNKTKLITLFVDYNKYHFFKWVCTVIIDYVNMFFCMSFNLRIGWKDMNKTLYKREWII